MIVIDKDKKYSPIGNIRPTLAENLKRQLGLIDKEFLHIETYLLGIIGLLFIESSYPDPMGEYVHPETITQTSDGCLMLFLKNAIRLATLFHDSTGSKEDLKGILLKLLEEKLKVENTTKH